MTKYIIAVSQVENIEVADPKHAIICARGYERPIKVLTETGKSFKFTLSKAHSLEKEIIELLTQTEEFNAIQEMGLLK